MPPVAPPVLLTIDDDPGVSRAVARDLRQRYGERFRVRRAESPASALDALHELRARDDRVALLLADQRMPDMTGVELLDEARAIFPTARRVLLTAYADTDAAIAAINDVKVDYYLLKPWDPPEEKLYPVLDDLLEDWAAQHPPPFEGVRVVGHRWSARSHAVKDFLARNLVPFQWLDAERDPGAARLLGGNGPGDGAGDGAGRDRLPLVLPPGGQALHSPSIGELAAALGLSSAPGLPFYDLVVVGAGPAGLGAAVYGASEGLRTLLIERDAVGGQAGQSSRIENYLGFPSGLSGADLTRRAATQARRFGAEMLLVAEAVGVERCGAGRVVRLASGDDVAAHTVLLTGGVSYTRLEPVDEFAGRGVYYGAATTEGMSCKDDDVFVVGGANSAGQAAVYFARWARHVTLLVRGDDLGKSMSHYLIAQISELENVSVRTGVEVVGASGEGHLERLLLRDRVTGDQQEIDASWLFVFIGAAPRTEWLGEDVRRDSRGFVLTGPDVLVDGRPPPGWDLDRQPYYLESSVPGVFAAGDMRHESVKRVASAVGEGAMAVTLVHRYLEHL
ncbi:MAG: FAD-dependent oxidoreductase [Actinomycetota bacterium]